MIASIYHLRAVGRSENLGCWEGGRVGGGMSSNVEGIICHLVEIRLADLPKSEGTTPSTLHLVGYHTTLALSSFYEKIGTIYNTTDSTC